MFTEKEFALLVRKVPTMWVRVRGETAETRDPALIAEWYAARRDIEIRGLVPDNLAPVTVEHPDWTNQVLCCPNCGSSYLHHGVITIYSSNEDDFISRTTVDPNGDVSVSRTDDGSNPSRRRDGASIAFACEECDRDTMELTLSQHKGVTLTEWRVAQTFLTLLRDDFGPMTD
jgi:hypothetical protein